MPTRVDVDTDQLFGAADRLISDVLGSSTRGLESLVAVLDDGHGMAGSDPPARQWAGEYDDVVRSVMTTSAALFDATYRIGTLIEHSARNYECAEAASTVGGPPVPPRLLHSLDWHADIRYPADAGGVGSTDKPTGWGLVEDAIGYMWPNGHQDKLHAAATAWRQCAGSFDGAGHTLPSADALIETATCPEGDAMVDAVQKLGPRFAELARVQRQLASACDALAHQIDHAHAEIHSELVSLLEFTVGAEVVGGLFSMLTFGAAEAPTQAVVGVRIAEAASAIRAVLAGMSGAVRGPSVELPALAEAAEAVRAALAPILRARPALAGMRDVEDFTMYSKAARGAGGAGKAGRTERAGEAGRSAGRTKVMARAESPVWKNFKPFRGKTRTNGLQGSKTRFYQWDHTHGDIEVYGPGGEHLGSMDAATGRMIKDAEPGRRLTND